MLRPPSPDDATAMIDYMKMTAAETPFLLRNPDEISVTVDDERRFLENMLSSPRDIMIVAELDGVVAGNCSVSPRGSKRRLAHRAVFGIALKQAYTGLGVGSAMLEYAIALAHNLAYEQMELSVICGNRRAISLYERYGFKACGSIPNAIKYDDGTYRDELQMIKTL